MSVWFILLFIPIGVADVYRIREHSQLLVDGSIGVFFHNI